MPNSMPNSMPSEPQKTKSKLRYLPILFLLGASLIVLVQLSRELTRLHTQSIKANFVADTNRISTMIDERMAAYSQVLRSGAAFFAGSNAVERDEWHAFVEKLDLGQNYQGIQGVGFSVVVPKQTLSAHMSTIRSQGFPDYIVKPEGDRELYTSIIYLEPFTGRNLRAFGYDMFSETTRNEAMSRARDIGDVTFSGKVHLLQETKKDVQAGILAYFPVYKNGVIAQTVEQRRAALVGWVYSPYRMNDLLDAIVRDSLVTTRLEVFDGDTMTPDNQLYDSHAQLPELAAVEHAAISTVQKIELGGRYWIMRYTTLPGYEVTHTPQPIWVGSLGLVTIGLLLTVLSWLLINTRRSAETIASQLTASIRKSEARYNALFANSKVPMLLIDPQSGQILEANRTAVAFYGYSQDTLEVMNIADINTLSRQEIATEMAKADQEKRSYFYFKHRLANDSIRDVEVHSGPIDVEGQQMLYSIIHDVTERKSLEQQLHASEERFNFAIEGSGDGMWDWNITTGKVYFSKRWKAMLGISDDEITDSLEEWEKRVHADDKAKVMADIQRYFEGHTQCYINEHRLLCQDGSYKWILDRGIAAARGADGKPTRMIGTHTDMTERREAAEALRKAKETAESLAQSKSDFLANMSHEIRTPMNGIIGLSKLVLEKEVSAEVRDYLEKINTSSESLLGIVNDILDFSKLEAGKFSIAHQRFDLEIVLDNLNTLFLHSATEKSLAFEIDIAENTCTDLIGDGLRLQQILANLIGNAIKFTDRGHVRLQIKPFQPEDALARLEFSVSDTGIGITEADQKKLFQPFSQVDTSATRRFGGSGLGLAIAKQLLELMGSQLSVESTPGRGSIFRFTLPVALASGQLHHTIGPRSKALSTGALGSSLRHKGRTLAGARILVAEDNKINQQVVKEFLKLAHVEVCIANNGVEVLESLKRRVFDAILMDVHMPSMGGVEATEIIRSNAQYAKLPIIALTAGVTEDERIHCLKAGMDDFLPKPVDPEQMMILLSQWIVMPHLPQQTSDPAHQPANDAMTTPGSSEDESKPSLHLTEDGSTMSSSELVWPSIAGINADYARHILIGDQNLFVELLTLYADENLELIERLKNHLSRHEWPEATQIVHKLKGQVANLGAQDLAAKAYALEMALKTNTAADINECFERFITENSRLLASVSHWLKPCKSMEKTAS